MLDIVSRKLRDPLHYQVTILSGLLLYGLVALEFEFHGATVATIIGSALLTQALFTRWLSLPRFDPRSPLISGLSLCLLLRTNSLGVAAAAAALANRRQLLALTLISLSLAAPAAEASDQRNFAQKLPEIQNLAHRVAELEEHLQTSEANEEDWTIMLSWFLADREDSMNEGKEFREEFLALYAQRRNWEPQAALLEDREATHRQEKLRWTLAATHAFPNNGNFRLRLLRLERKTGVSLNAIQELAEELPHDPTVAFCHARGLEMLESPEKGAQYLATFVAAHPDDPDAYQSEIDFLGRSHKDVLPALQRRAELFPKTARFQVELLQAVANRVAEDLNAWFLDLAGTAESVLERASLCQVLTRATQASSSPPDCFHRLWEDLVGEGTQGKESREMEMARGEVLTSAIKSGDHSLALEVLHSMPAKEAALGWTRTLQAWGSGDETCGSLLVAYLNGHFESVLAEPSGAEIAWIQLSKALGGCQYQAEAELVSKVALPRLPTETLGELARFYSETRPELQRRFEKLIPDPESARILGQQPDLLPDLPRDKVLEAWATTSDSVEPWFLLVKWLTKEQRYEEAEKAATAALRRHSGEIDLELHLVGLALLRGDDARSVALAEAIGRNRSASPRQQVTARYFLGRVARRQGRMKEAADHLEAYFLRRFRYAGCCQSGTDEGLLAHLNQTASPERLINYLDAKTKALAAFATTSRRLVASFYHPFFGCAKEACASFPTPFSPRDYIMEAFARKQSQRKDVLAWVKERQERADRWKRLDLEPIFDENPILNFDAALEGYETSRPISRRAARKPEEPLLGKPFNPWNPGCPW